MESCLVVIWNIRVLWLSCTRGQLYYFILTGMHLNDRVLERIDHVATIGTGCIFLLIQQIFCAR